MEQENEELAKAREDLVAGRRNSSSSAV